MTVIRGSLRTQEVANNVIYNVDCDSTVYVGAAVYMTASGIAFNGLADDVVTSNIIGIVIAKSSTTKCDIRVAGVSEELFTSLDMTKEYFLSDITPGLIDITVPTNSGHTIVTLGKPFTDKRLAVKPEFRVIRA
jgi:hypothetical protein